MPIEIVELTVRASVRESSRSIFGSRNNSGSATQATDKDLIVREAVEKVLEILKQEKER